MKQTYAVVPNNSGIKELEKLPGNFAFGYEVAEQLKFFR